jgi:hypothetical protein
LPVWLLPVLAFALIFTPAWSTHTDLVFWLLLFPALLVSMYIAGIPLRQGLVTVSHAAFWAIVFPFLVWAAIIFGLFGLYFGLRALVAD